jgi:hypothetical protein
MAGDHFADEFAESAGYLRLNFSFSGEEQVLRNTSNTPNHIIVASNDVFVSWFFLVEHD